MVPFPYFFKIGSSNTTYAKEEKILLSFVCGEGDVLRLDALIKGIISTSVTH
jgi:hypothetical protein